MFEHIKLVKFHKLDKWHIIVLCWLNIFFNFAYNYFSHIFNQRQNQTSLWLVGASC